MLVKEGLGAQVYQHLRHDLMIGRYEPGQKLKLRDLANDLLGSVYCPNVRCTAFDVETPGNQEGVCVFCKTALVVKQ